MPEGSSSHFCQMSACPPPSESPCFSSVTRHVSQTTSSVSAPRLWTAKGKGLESQLHFGNTMGKSHQKQWPGMEALLRCSCGNCHHCLHNRLIFKQLHTHPAPLNAVTLFQAPAAEDLSPMHFTWALPGKKNIICWKKKALTFILNEVFWSVSRSLWLLNPGSGDSLVDFGI